MFEENFLLFSHGIGRLVATSLLSQN